MLSQRKVETISQYEKRTGTRRKLIATDALCEPHRLSTLSAFSMEETDTLEIYASRATQTMQKLRGRRGRSRLYRQFEVYLSKSSTSTSSTSPSLDTDIILVGSNTTGNGSSTQKDPTTSSGPSILSAPAPILLKEHASSLELVTPKTTKLIRKKKYEMSTDRQVRDKSMTSNQEQQRDLTTNEHGKDARTTDRVPYLYIQSSFLCFSVPNNKSSKKRSKHNGPGISVAEEQQLRQSVWKQDQKKRTSAHETTRRNFQIEQVEVVPVHPTFQSTGTKTVNYAELEGIGMVFAPSTQLEESRQCCSVSFPLWGQDRSVETSAHDVRPVHSGASFAGKSAKTKKMSNERKARDRFRPNGFVESTIQQDPFRYATTVNAVSIRPNVNLTCPVLPLPVLNQCDRFLADILEKRGSMFVTAVFSDDDCDHTTQTPVHDASTGTSREHATAAAAVCDYDEYYSRDDPIGTHRRFSIPRRGISNCIDVTVY